MRAREEAAAYAGRAWLKMSRADRRRATELMRRYRANLRLEAWSVLAGEEVPRSLARRGWRLLSDFYFIVEQSEDDSRQAHDARLSAEKCAGIHRAQTTKKGKQK
jgi:hypothetical protein